MWKYRDISTLGNCDSDMVIRNRVYFEILETILQEFIFASIQE